MFKKIMIGLATVVALSAYAPMDAAARGGHGGGGGGFHSGGGFHGGGGFRGAGTLHGGGTFGGGGRFAMSRVGMGGARFAGISSGHFRGNFVHRRHHFRHFAPFAIGFGVPYLYDDYYYSNYPYDDCYRLRRVHTRYGWRWRQIYVCG